MILALLIQTDISTFTLIMLQVLCVTKPQTVRSQTNTYSSTYIWRMLATMHIGENVSIENMLRMNDTTNNKIAHHSKC